MATWHLTNQQDYEKHRTWDIEKISDATAFDSFGTFSHSMKNPVYLSRVSEHRVLGPIIIYEPMITQWNDATDFDNLVTDIQADYQINYEHLPMAPNWDALSFRNPKGMTTFQMKFSIDGSGKTTTKFRHEATDSEKWFPTAEEVINILKNGFSEMLVELKVVGITGTYSGHIVLNVDVVQLGIKQ